MSLNKAIMIGRLTADVELRRTQSGTSVSSFSLAVDRGFTGSDGKKETDFIDIVSFGKTAEFVSKYFTKGKQVAVVGRIQTRSWEDRDGHRRKAVEVVADEVHFAESKKANEGGYGQPGAFDLGKVPKSDFDPLADDDMDDVPFF